ncbi:MAG: DUF3187 family protein [Planctomycetales bacterium]|nr:DUF3187 family protein [Planctomycetales bacterium]
MPVPGGARAATRGPGGLRGSRRRAWIGARRDIATGEDTTPRLDPRLRRTPVASLAARRRAGFLALALLLAGVSAARAEDPNSSGPPVTAGIAWLTDLPAALALSATTRRPVLVVWDAGWCPACREFRSGTVSAPEVQSFAESFHWVVVNIDRDLSLARSGGVKATPRVDLLDPDGITRVQISGVVSPAEFRRQLEAFLEDLRASPRADATRPASLVEGEDATPLAWSGETYRGLSICFASVGYGPLNLTSQSPFQALRFGLEPRTPSTLARGQFEVRETETWVNVWARNQGDFLLDFEMLQSRLSVAYGISDTLQADVTVVDKSWFAGVADGFIEGFHDLFGLSQGGRTDHDRDRFRVEIAATPRSPAVLVRGDDAGGFSREVLLTLQQNITCGTESGPSIALAATLRSDFGQSRYVRGGAVDVGVSASAAQRLGDLYAYAAAGFAWFGEEKFLGIPLRETQLSGLVAVEWRFLPRMSFVAQYLVTEGVARRLHEFSLPSHEITVGWKGEIGGRGALEIGFIENIVTFDNSPDFGVHLGFGQRF